MKKFTWIIDKFIWNDTRMQNETLHIASSLFFIFHKASSIKKMEFRSLIEEVLSKMEINEKTMC